MLRYNVRSQYLPISKMLLHLVDSIYVYIHRHIFKPSLMSATNDRRLATNPVVVNSRASHASLRSITLITACTSTLFVLLPSCPSTTMASASVCHFVVIHVYRRIGRLSALLQVQVGIYR